MQTHLCKHSHVHTQTNTQTHTGQLPLAIERQAAAAIEESHAIIMVVDGQTGLTGADEEVITWLRRHYPDKPTTLAVNKCENSSKADIMVCKVIGVKLLLVLLMLFTMYMHPIHILLYAHPIQTHPPHVHTSYSHPVYNPLFTHTDC